MIFLLNILIIGGLGWLSCRCFYKQFGWVAIWGMLAKAIGALALGWVYFYHQEQRGDTFGLWQQIIGFNEHAAISFSNYWTALFAPIDPFQSNPRSIFFARLISPLGLLSQHSYVALSGYLCLFSYWTSWTFMMVFDRFYPQVRLLALMAFCFFPTFLFWSSGFLKDTLINGALFYLTASLIVFYHTKKLSLFQWILSAIMFGCLFMTRHYLAGLFSIITLLLLTDQWITKYGLKARIGLFTAISALGAYGIRFFFIRLRPERFPITFHELHQEFLTNPSAGSNIQFDLQPTWVSLLSSLPNSLWTGLFRPGLWEVKGFFQVLESLQTTVLMLGFLLSMVLLRKVKELPAGIWVLFLFVVILATFLPLASPNFGSLSRYRVAYTPFLAFLVMYLPFRRFIRNDL